MFRKLKKFYISVLMKLFKKNRIDHKKLERFVSSVKNSVPGRRAGAYINLSIVIPCYNHAGFLSTTFESIVEQTLPPDEVIFIDDASTDQTREVLAGLINGYRGGKIRFKLFEQTENRGQAAAINHGVELAVNELIMVLNDDDYLMHDAVQKTVEIFNQEQDIYLLGSKAIRVYDEYFLKNMRKKSTDFTVADKVSLKKYTPRELMGIYQGKGIDMTHSAMSFSKLAWQAAGGYKTKRRERVIIYSDRDFQIRVSLLFPIAVAGETPFSFWRSSSSVDAGLFT